MTNISTPPGYPIGYTMQSHHYLCTGCGRTQTAELLIVIEKSSNASGRSYHTAGKNEKLYALPVGATTTHFTTPRCSACISTLPREPVPAMPSMTQRLKHTGNGIGPTMEAHLARAEGAGASKPSPAPKYTSILDLDV